MRRAGAALPHSRISTRLSVDRMYALKWDNENNLVSAVATRPPVFAPINARPVT